MPPGSPLDWIALNLLPGLGPLTRRRALERYGDPGEVAYKIPVDELLGLRGFGAGSAARVRSARKRLRKEAESEWRRCRRAGVRVIPEDDPDYPAAFEPLPDRPVLLYVDGRLEPGVARVALVGSRRPTSYGRRVATGLAGGLAARGIEVVSGGARGIDTCAHRGALGEGGRTIAVLGSGLLCRYPPENEALFEEIAAAGAVVSEYPLETPPQAHHFPSRNRLISGLSAAVVVVEAARRSGSLITAAQALDQDREVLAVPGPVSSARSEGCNRLIQQGAKLVQELGDILVELPPIYLEAVDSAPPKAPGEETDEAPDWSPDEAKLLEMLDEIDPVHVDDLARRAPFGVDRLQAALFGLELRGAVEQTPGRYYVTRPRRDP